ncbi:hypothetical protein IF2G_02033 [Cordyceps javanica]|nr:hypothetical protein IF2G_02033 [Cordyceps javanica]
MGRFIHAKYSVKKNELDEAKSTGADDALFKTNGYKETRTNTAPRSVVYGDGFHPLLSSTTSFPNRKHATALVSRASATKSRWTLRQATGPYDGLRMLKIQRVLFSLAARRTLSKVLSPAKFMPPAPRRPKCFLCSRTAARKSVKDHPM